MSAQESRFSTFLYVAAAAGLLASVSPGLRAQVSPELTQTLCMACHRDKFEALGANPHAVLDSAAWRQRTDGALSCIGCHGEVSAHIAAGGGQGNVFAFREESASEQNARCLTCHATTHPEFAASDHAAAGLACISCHSQHGAAPRGAALLKDAATSADFAAVGGATAICFDCHGEIFSQFAFNERHRLQEGVLDCTSCHDPHARETRRLLGGFKQAQCEGCHSDKSGPFVFEHQASRTEGCTACHSPHGAPNRHLLTHQSVAEMCYACHAAVPQFHAGFSPVGPPRFGLDTQCTNCHSAIHGSNFHPAFLQ